MVLVVRVLVLGILASELELAVVRDVPRVAHVERVDRPVDLAEEHLRRLQTRCHAEIALLLLVDPHRAHDTAPRLRVRVLVVRLPVDKVRIKQALHEAREVPRVLHEVDRAPDNEPVGLRHFLENWRERVLVVALLRTTVGGLAAHAADAPGIGDLVEINELGLRAD